MSDTILYLLLGTTEPAEIENAEVKHFFCVLLYLFNPSDLKIRQNMFAIMRCCYMYIRVLFHIFYCYWFPKNLKLSEILTSLLGVSWKISQVTQFLTKSSDSQKNFVFLPKQAFLELIPRVVINVLCVKVS